MGAGVPDAFPPRCVVWVGLFTRFVWVDYTWMVGFVGVGLRDKILRSVVGAVPMCPPVSPCKGASIVQFPTHNAYIFWYGNAAARMFGRAHRHRPYGFVWMNCVRVVLFDCWENGAQEPTPSVLYF